MKIAFVSTVLGYAWGGADTLWTHAAEAAVRRGDGVLLALSPLTATHSRVQKLLAAGAQLHQRRAPVAARGVAARLRGKTARWLGQGDPLVSALRRFGPDLVIFSCGGTYDLILETEAVRWLKEARTPFRFIANWQAEQPVLDATALGRATEVFAAAERVFFVSSRNLEVTRAHLRAPLLQARVLQNPLRISPTDFDPPPWPVAATWHFATVGRLEPVKGLTLLATTLSRVLGSNHEWRLSVFGEGPQRDELPQLFSTQGIGDRAAVRGYQPDLAAIWAEHHLLISPALDEGVPMTIPEAMLYARPVLATSVGGARDWITEGTGFIAPTPTTEALAATIDDAWARRDSWRAMGIRARAAAVARYRPDDYLDVIAAPSC